jgi:hypothetical protein
VLLTSVLGLWSFEAYGYISLLHKKLDVGYANFDTFMCADASKWTSFLQQHQHTRNDYQAILVLPFFEVGSEKLWQCADDNTTAIGIAAGIQAGVQLELPMVNAMLSRTSWGVAFKQVKIVGGPDVEKPMLSDLKSDKPFLLLVVNNAPLDPYQQYLLAASDYVGDFWLSKVYTCYPERIKQNDRKHQSEINKNILAGDYCQHYTGNWFVNHFDGKSSVHSTPFSDNEGVAFNTKANPIIADIKLQPAFDQQLYEFSCWFRVTATDYKSADVSITIMDSTDKVLLKTDAFGKLSTDNYKLWLRTNAFIKMPINTRRIKCTINDIEEHNYEAFDELMIKPYDAMILSKFPDGSIWVNNHKQPEIAP